MSALLELKEATGKLEAKRAEMAALMAKKTPDGKLDWKAEDHDRFNALNPELNDLHDEVIKWKGVQDAEKKTRDIEDYLRSPASGAPIGDGRDRERKPERKSVGEVAVESPQYKQYVNNHKSGVATIDLPGYGLVDLKTTMTTAAGYSPFVTRGPDIVPYALRRPMLQDLLPSYQTTERGVAYMEETTVTMNAAPVAEAATKPESARAFTERTVLAEVIATTLPVSEQQLDDAPFIMGYINQTLGLEVELAEENQLLTGNGSTPQIQGFLTKSGVQTQAKNSDPVITAFMKALTLIRYTGFAEPDGSVWHPNDWQDVVTLQDTTGRYIYGDPFTQTAAPRLVGMPVVVTPAETENTVLIGAFRQYSYIIRRQGLRIDIGWVNDNFQKNLKTIRAETRLALAIRRPAAFCKLTGV